MTRTRDEDLNLFYTLLRPLPRQSLRAACLTAPARGVCFFLEPAELRRNGEPRISYISTHGVTVGSASTLPQRLLTHAGGTGGGNHRMSVLRLLTGEALARRSGITLPETWGVKTAKARANSAKEQPLEAAVSHWLAGLQVICLEIADPPGSTTLRKRITQGAIALLSNADRPPLDPPSAGWAGHHSTADAVRRSGLWNRNHVAKPHDPDFIALLSATLRDGR